MELFEPLILWPLEALLQAAFAVLWPTNNPVVMRQLRACRLLALGAIVALGLGTGTAILWWSIIPFAIGFVVAYILAMAAGVLGHRIEERQKKQHRKQDEAGRIPRS